MCMKLKRSFWAVWNGEVNLQSVPWLLKHVNCARPHHDGHCRQSANSFNTSSVKPMWSKIILQNYRQTDLTLTPCRSINFKDKTIKSSSRASLVAQWLRICLPMQGTRVQALVWEDPTCHGATGPVSHNYWACVSGACAPQQERPRWWEARAPRWRVVPTCHN